jgi:surfeit locus 1 family protein
MMFRPYPVLSIAAAAILAVLVWLGFWQLSRAEWKQGLIRAHEAATKVEAGPLREAMCDRTPGAVAIVSRSEVVGRVDETRAPIRMFGRGPDGEPGWKVLRPMAPPDCMESPGPVLVEMSFEPLVTTDYPDAAMREPERLSVAAWPRKGAFAAPNDPANNDWHWFDAPAMATAMGLQAINGSIYLSGSLEDSALLRTPPSQHVGYAVTWFGMAAGLLLVYAAFHARAGRLRFGADRSRPE